MKVANFFVTSRQHVSDLLRGSWRQEGDRLRTCHGEVTGKLLLTTSRHDSSRYTVMSTSLTYLLILLQHQSAVDTVLQRKFSEATSICSARLIYPSRLAMKKYSWLLGQGLLPVLKLQYLRWRRGSVVARCCVMRGFMCNYCVQLAAIIAGIPTRCKNCMQQLYMKPRHEKCKVKTAWGSKCNFSYCGTNVDFHHSTDLLYVSTQFDRLFMLSIFTAAKHCSPYISDTPSTAVLEKKFQREISLSLSCV